MGGRRVEAWRVAGGRWGPARWGGGGAKVFCRRRGEGWERAPGGWRSQNVACSSLSRNIFALYLSGGFLVELWPRVATTTTRVARLGFSEREGGSFCANPSGSTTEGVVKGRRFEGRTSQGGLQESSGGDFTKGGRERGLRPAGLKPPLREGSWTTPAHQRIRSSPGRTSLAWGHSSTGWSNMVILIFHQQQHLLAICSP